MAQETTTLRCVGEGDRLVEWVVPTELAKRIARGELYIELYGARPWRYAGEESVERIEADSVTLRRELERVAAGDPRLIWQPPPSSAEPAVGEHRRPTRRRGAAQAQSS